MEDYGRFHRDRVNLLIHIVAVPFFIYGAYLLVRGAVVGRWLDVVFGLVAILVSMAAQGQGHKRERNPPLPFDGPADFVKRILLEQFYKFPMYVLSGGWLRALRASS